jgi:outer membrane protein
MKRAALFLIVCLAPCFCLGAQQLTRFAVVDLPKVHSAYFRDSRAVRDWEERSRRVQTEIDRMAKEIQDLKSKQADALMQGNQDQSARLENEIYRKSEALKNYYSLKTAELEDQRNKLARSDPYYKEVHDQIRYIAESEGYSMVLNLKDISGILWFSPSVDITDKVIQNLLDKAKR